MIKKVEFVRLAQMKLLKLRADIGIDHTRLVLTRGNIAYYFYFSTLHNEKLTQRKGLDFKI